MKKMILTMMALLVLLPASAQKKVIDMDSFKEYLKEYSQAQSNKDREKIAEIESGKGQVYARKTIKKRVIKSWHHYYYEDVEACAFLAAYYEADYYRKRRESDLANAVRYYEWAIKNGKEEVAQVKLHYARFLIEFERQSQSYVNVLVKAGALKKGYYDHLQHKDVVYSDEELCTNLVSKIAGLIQASGDAGYDVGAYYWARISRGYDVPGGDTSIYWPNTLRGWVVRWKCYSKKYYQKLEQLGPADYPQRNEDVVKYYTIAASGGKPQYQMEFAEYLLRTRCSGWKASWASKSYDWPFIYDYKNHTVFDGHDFVFDEFGDSELWEQVEYWYLQAAKHEYAPAMVDLAFWMFYEMHTDADPMPYSEIVYWLEKASNLGDPTAMYNLCVVKLLDDVRTITRQDSLDAFYWARRGADSGDFKCQHLLGRYYYSGIGVRVDKKEALKWFKAAADKGSQGAAYMAGKLYADKTVGNDMALAVKYYESANAISEAYLDLAELYEKGNGVVMDKQKARKYRGKAEDLNNDHVYRLFDPGLCFYSFSDYEGLKKEPSIIKQNLL